jgi:RNA polymerase sigma factor FliA
MVRSVPPHVELEDLVGAGSLGLVDAVDKFEPQRGVPFEGYAMLRIRGSILDGARTGDWAPRSVRHQVRELNRAISGLQSQLGDEPADEHVAAAMGTSVDNVRRMRIDRERVKLDPLYGMTGETLIESEDVKSRQLDLGAELTEVAVRVAQRMSALTGQHRTLAVLLFLERMSLAEAGRELGISETRVCQIRPGMLRALAG